MELIGKAKLSRLFTYLFTSLYCEWVPRTLYKRRITVQYSASVFLIVYKLLLRVYIQYCLLVCVQTSTFSVQLFLKPRQQTYSDLCLLVCLQTCCTAPQAEAADLQRPLLVCLQTSIESVQHCLLVCLKIWCAVVPQAEAADLQLKM